MNQNADLFSIISKTTWSNYLGLKPPTLNSLWSLLVVSTSNPSVRLKRISLSWSTVPIHFSLAAHVTTLLEKHILSTTYLLSFANVRPVSPAVLRFQRHIENTFLFCSTDELMSHYHYVHLCSESLGQGATPLLVMLVKPLFYRYTSWSRGSSSTGIDL